MTEFPKLRHHPRRRAVPPQRPARWPMVALALTLVALVVGAIVVSNLAAPPTPVITSTARPLTAPTGMTPDGFAYKGRPDAPVTVIEYGDYQCPACAAYATQLEAQIDHEYVERGKIRFIYHDFPLAQHPHARITATAARAAGAQGKYWAMHDLLFAQQHAWATNANIKPLLGSYADALGLDRAAFEQVLNADPYQDALTTAYRQGTERGVEGTPTFEVNGELVGSAELVPAIERALQASGQ